MQSKEGGHLLQPLHMRVWASSYTHIVTHIYIHTYILHTQIVDIHIGVHTYKHMYIHINTVILMSFVSYKNSGYLC